MQFADALASSIHDIKNSLSLMSNVLEQILDDPETRIGNPKKAQALRLEAQRANTNLMQLLSLYKLDNHQLSPDVREHNLDDVLDDLLAENVELMQALDIQLETANQAMNDGFFDINLVSCVISSAIGNAQRYTRDRILVSAAEEDGFLVLRVEDNGSGFPPAMLESAAVAGNGSNEGGHTQLGMYFAAQIAALHRNGERAGFIRLVNGHTLEGGCFELWLP